MAKNIKFKVERDNKYALGWGVSIVCLFVIFGSLYVGDLFLGLSQLSRLQSLLFARLQTEPSLTTVIEDEKFEDLFFRGTRGKLTQVRRISSILNNVDKGNFERASSVLDKGGLPETAEAEKIEQVVEEAMVISKIGEKSGAIEARLKSREEILKERYDALVGELIVDLKVDIAASKNGQFEFHEKGVLETLPVVPGVPDGFEKPVDIEPHLINQSRLLSFMEKPEGLKQQAALLRLSLKELESDRDRYKKDNENNQNKIDEIKKNVQENAKSILLILAKPKLTAREITVYHVGNSLLERFGASKRTSDYLES